MIFIVFYNPERLVIFIILFFAYFLIMHHNLVTAIFWAPRPNLEDLSKGGAY